MTKYTPNLSAQVFERPINLGSCLRALRMCHDLNLSDFARKIGVTKTTLDELERGQSCPKNVEVVRMATALGFDNEVFIDYAQRLRGKIGKAKAGKGPSDL